MSCVLRYESVAKYVHSLTLLYKSTSLIPQRPYQYSFSNTIFHEHVSAFVFFFLLKFLYINT